MEELSNFLDKNANKVCGYSINYRRRRWPLFLKLYNTKDYPIYIYKITSDALANDYDEISIKMGKLICDRCQNLDYIYLINSRLLPKITKSINTVTISTLDYHDKIENIYNLVVNSTCDLYSHAYCERIVIKYIMPNTFVSKPLSKYIPSPSTLTLQAPIWLEHLQDYLVNIDDKNIHYYDFTSPLVKSARKK